MEEHDSSPNTAAGVAREAIRTIATLRSLLKSQETELRQATKAEIRQAGMAFKTEADQASHVLHRKMEEVIAKADRAAEAFIAAQDAVAGQRRRLWWGLGAVIVLCVASLVATYEIVYGFYQARYDELKAQVTYLSAINHSDVVPCGDGQLCARVDDKSPRYGDKKQYRVVEPRP